MSVHEWILVKFLFNMPWYLYIVHLLFLCICIFVDSIVSRTLPPVHWNSSNSVFKTSNNDHVIDIHMNDDIDFFCPHYPEGTDPELHEYYVIYRVSKESYENCKIDPKDKMRLEIVNCSKPSDQKRVTVSVISFSPIPRTPEFREGETYYFITTSTGRKHEINNENHGACFYRNMKLSLKVCCQSTTTSPHLSTNHTTIPPISTNHPTSNLTTANTVSMATNSKSIKATTTVASSPSTSTTTSRAPSTTNVKWRTSTTGHPETSTKKSREDNDSSENEVLPKTGSHVNGAISTVHSGRTLTLYKLTGLLLLTHAVIIWLIKR